MCPTETPATLPMVTVGTKLAFRQSSGGYSIYSVQKISPTGRLTVGDAHTPDRYVLNPDMTIRGYRTFNDPDRGELVTQAILDTNARIKLREKLLRTDWYSARLTLEKLQQIHDIVYPPKPQEETCANDK